MTRLGLADLRRGITLLPGDESQPPVDLVVQPPGMPVGQPYGIARLPDGRLVTADRAAHRIVAVAEDGSNYASFGVRGNGDGQFESPSGVAVGPDARILIADTGNCRIVAIDTMRGDGWRSYGSKGSSTLEAATPGRFYRPVGIAADADGIVVADAGAARIIQLSSMDDSGWRASPPGVFRNPVAVALMPGGTIVAADLAARAIIFLSDASLPPVEIVADPLIPGPTALAVIDDDRLAVCCVPSNCIVKLSRTAGLWSAAVDRTLDNLGIRRPTAICLLP